MEGNYQKNIYGKKSIWKWILIYAVAGAAAYGLVYYFFFSKNSSYSNLPNQGSSKTQEESVPDEQTVELTPLGTPVPGTSGVQEKIVISQYILEADDYGFYPNSTITVAKGENVKLTFKVRTSNVYYGGLEFRSPKFNTGAVKPGESTTVEFVANESFAFTSYWPVTNIVKANGNVVVN